MKEVTEMKVIGDETYQYTSGYFTDNKWIDNDTIVITRWKDSQEGSCDAFGENELIKLNVVDESIEILCKDKIGWNLVYADKAYYTNGREIVEIDVFTKESKIIYKCENYEEGKKIEYLSITSDGKYMGVGLTDQNENPTKMQAIERETGMVLYEFEAGFEKPFYFANHVMICPTNPKLMYYAHEGITSYISNRMWLYDADTKKKWNMAKQRLDEDGNLGDCFGHEMWAQDGKGMYFVKYPRSSMGQKGIMYVDVETGHMEMIASAYNYWHVSVLENGKYLAADSFEPDKDGRLKAGVIVIDREDHTETFIDLVNRENHPAHPHPMLSPKADKIIYNDMDENNRVIVKVAFLK